MTEANDPDDLAQSLHAIAAALDPAGVRRLAAAAGVSHHRLSTALRTGRGIAAFELSAIAEQLRTDVAELLTFYNDPHRVTVYVCGHGPVDLAELGALDLVENRIRHRG